MSGAEPPGGQGRDERVFAARLHEARRRAGLDGAGTAISGPSAASGLALAFEFVAHVGVGTGLGFGIDRLAGTLPLFMGLGLLFGLAAGVLQMVRRAQRQGAGHAVAGTVGPRMPAGHDEIQTAPVAGIGAVKDGDERGEPDRTV